MRSGLQSMMRKAHDVRLAALRLRHNAEAVIGYLPTDTMNAEIDDRKRFIRSAFEALKINGIAGDYAEFGSASAVTFRLAFAANRLAGTHRHLWSFDSFAGLPEQGERDAHPLWVPGTMAMSLDDFRETCRHAGMTESDYTTVKGFYSKTLRDDAEGIRPSKIAFAYVDCDLYSSSTDVLKFLRARLCQGMVIAFDDYYCFGPTEASGERLALANLTSGLTEWRFVPYIQFGWHGMSFMVERSELIDDPTPW
jgi:O-methyltransferase